MGLARERTMRRWVMVLWVAVAATACKEEIVCPTGWTLCGGQCVDPALDAGNCGACGVSCGAGEACRSGACTSCALACGDGQACEHGVCRAAVYVACFATNDVRGVTASLDSAGPGRPVSDGPIALAWAADRLWVTHSLPPPVVLGFEPNVDGEVQITLGGGDLEEVAGAHGRVHVSNAMSSTLVVIDPDHGVRDEIPLAPSPGVAANPRGVAVTGDVAVVALYGPVTPAFGQGQEIVLVDVAPSAACTEPPCGSVTRRISLDVQPGDDTPGAYDPPGFPFPAYVATVGTRAFVTLANLKESCGDFGCYYTDPAGDGRLAVVDTTAPLAAPSFVDLGAGCVNPGSIAVDGTTLWISCGGSGAILPVDASGPTPVPGSPVPIALTPGAIAACGGQVYVGDQYSGQVARVAASGGDPLVASVCTGGPYFDWAADVLCTGAAP